MTTPISRLLELIEENDTNYDVRNIYIWELFLECKKAGYECSIGDDWECSSKWRVVRIILPDAGQVSWHVPDPDIKYDEHSTEQKYNRCKTYRVLYG